jgi:Ca2+-binding EF-hand superfamily protein
MNGMQRPDPSKMADSLFSKLDTKGQGYIEKSDLQGAFDQVSAKRASDNMPSVDDVFKTLDGDGDGKVTKQEMSDSVQKLADQLDSQYQDMRMRGKGGGMGGMSKSDISSMADSASGSAAQVLSNLAQNFDAADTNQDGKISAQEAMAFQASNETDSSSSEAQRGDAGVMARIMELAASYGAFGQDEQASGSTISTAA